MENPKRIVGITFSTFDLLHAGHIAMLREAKDKCDYLICGLQVDPSQYRPEKNAPVQSLVERWTQLQAVKYVDEIIPYQSEDEVEDILQLFDIDVRIIGSEYQNGKFTGRAICAARGIEINFNKRDHRFSTSDLRGRVHNAEKVKNEN
jgi:glycerol-3-phosphate cytidylyltransferase|tara:strand:- start:941 stop:1384 length:444 start_codon:yes stop_codon:yes gene_type:complete